MNTRRTIIGALFADGANSLAQLALADMIEREGQRVENLKKLENSIVATSGHLLIQFFLKSGEGMSLEEPVCECVSQIERSLA